MVALQIYWPANPDRIQDCLMAGKDLQVKYTLNISLIIIITYMQYICRPIFCLIMPGLAGVCQFLACTRALQPNAPVRLWDRSLQPSLRLHPYTPLSQGTECYIMAVKYTVYGHIHYTVCY